MASRLLAVTGTAAMALLILGVAGLEAPRDVNLPPVSPPVALGTGALLAEYTVYFAAAYVSMPPQLADTLQATRPLRRILIAALLLVSAFWATAVVAEQRGNAVAQAIEASLPVQPEAVVYSSQRLQITGPGITETRLSPTDAAFAFRYNGLRPLIHSGGHWFLLPAGWTHSNGATVIILPDTEPGIRVESALKISRPRSLDAEFLASPERYASRNGRVHRASSRSTHRPAASAHCSCRLRRHPFPWTHPD